MNCSYILETNHLLIASFAIFSPILKVVFVLLNYEHTHKKRPVNAFFIVKPEYITGVP